MAEYTVLASRAMKSGEKIFFADEAYFQADAELRGKGIVLESYPQGELSSPLNSLGREADEGVSI